MTSDRDRTLENARRAPLGNVHRLSIAVSRGPDAGKLIEPPAGEGASIGTAEDNALVLTDRTVSRYHLELRPTAGGIALRDLGSTNGTLVGGIRLIEALIPRGSQVRIGDSILVIDAADAPAEPAPARLELPGLVYASEPMRKLAAQIHALAGFAGSLLVFGETGTGKELIAHAVHALGPRKAGPFVIVDCASLPPNLVESELFGHERGAFTGAERARAGAFERAAGGTVFLDEVGELPLAMQPVLLGALERKRIRRVGGDKEIAVDVRVVSASHRDLRAEVNRGTFRADLYYRLAAARVVVPPLRDRVEDIPVLARHFARELTGLDEDPFTAEAMASLSAQLWPGNVRELRNAVERAVALRMSGVVLDEEPLAAPAAAEPIERYRDARAKAIDAFERAYLSRLIETCGGNASEAARRAQMDRPYLLSLLRRYGLRT
jgi:transcriptional regulator with GAF, ATPase, and Fis domain